MAGMFTHFRSREIPCKNVMIEKYLIYLAQIGNKKKVKQGQYTTYKKMPQCVIHSLFRYRLGNKDTDRC